MYSVESTNHPPTFLICCVNNWGKDFLTLDLGLVHCLIQFMSTSLFRFTVSSHTFYLLAKTSCCKKKKLAKGDLFYNHTIIHKFCSKEIR